MIIYENENARLLIENGTTNLTSHVNQKSSDIYITEETALSVYNIHYNHEIENPLVMVGDKVSRLIPIVRMKMI